MLDTTQVRRIALETLEPGSALDARVKVTADLDGEEIIDMTVVFSRGVIEDLLRPDQPVDQGVLGTKSRLWRALQAAGEERFAQIRFESEDEQGEDADPES